jgi:hypothetical protein
MAAGVMLRILREQIFKHSRDIFEHVYYPSSLRFINDLEECLLIVTITREIPTLYLPVPANL